MTARGPSLLRQIPRLTVLLMVGPVLAGLAGTVWPALSGDAPSALSRLLDWAGLPAALRLSLVTGILSTFLSLALALAITAALYGTPAFRRVERVLAPLLSLPHAAAALGLAFLIAPSGWIARALAPIQGWTVPPDLLILNDPWGIALVAGLVAKEVPFLLLMVLAALPQTDAARRLTLSQTLGYGQVSGIVLGVLPALYRQLRLPVYAVLAYSMTSVEMAMILGPTLPPPLAVQIVLWANMPDIAGRDLAAAGALVLLAALIVTLVLWRGGEAAARGLLIRAAMRGRRGRGWDAPSALIARAASLLVAGGLFAGMAGLALWSVAGAWVFPQFLPQGLTTATWARALPDLTGSAATTLTVAALSTLAALALVLGCLQAEDRFDLHPQAGALWLLYLPLLVPQVAFLPGLHGLMLRAGVEASLPAVALAHLVFVLPYVFLSLSSPFRAWDRRIALAGAALGSSEARIFWRLRLPMLLAPVLTAAAVGMAVSIGQYLPTLMIGGGRVETVTTAAVALSSGGNRRLTGAYALLQVILPALGFALALALPRLAWRNRRGMRA